MENLLPRFKAAKQLEDRDRNIIIRSAYSTIESRHADTASHIGREGVTKKFKLVQRERIASHAPVNISTLYKAVRLVAPSRRLPRKEMMKLSPYSADDPSPLSARVVSPKGVQTGAPVEVRRVEGGAASSSLGVRSRRKAGPERSTDTDAKRGANVDSTRASTAPALGVHSASTMTSSFHQPSKITKEVRSTLVKFSNLSASGRGMDIFFLGYEVGGVNCSNIAPRETCARRTRGVVKTKPGEEKKKRTSGVNIYTGIRVGQIPDFLKSTDDTVPITVKFSNNDTVCVYEVLWLDYSGHPMSRMVLSPGESFVEKSFISHPWMVRAWPRSSGLADVLGAGGLQQSAQTLYDNGIPADALMDEPNLFDKPGIKESEGCVFVLGKDAEHKSNQFSIVFSPPLARKEGRRNTKRTKACGVSFMAKKRTPKGPHVSNVAFEDAVAAAGGMGLGTGSRLPLPGPSLAAKRPATAGPVASMRNSPKEVQSLLEPNVVVVMMRQM